MKAKKKAFTLTELLVVVVIIGVLSAVVLPKFTKMLEGFKTAEAEHFLEAVRNEQEARCTLGKPYATNTTELTTWAKGDSKHFEYTLSGGGMVAQRKGEDYSLSIPSYADGRICCDNCEGLDRNYVSCDDLKAQSDYVSDGGCNAGGCGAQPDRTSRSCGCGGHYVDHFNTEGCTWDMGTECIGNDTSYTEGQQKTTQGTGTAGDGTNNCGTKIEEYTCINGSWDLVTVQDFESCGEPETCVQTQEPEVSCGCGGHYQQTWNQEECRWDPSEVCVGETQPQMPSASCGCNDTGHYEYTWNQNTCAWETDSVCVGEDTSACEETCKWKKTKELQTCILSWEMYCYLSQQNAGAGNWVPFLRESANCNIGDYFASSGVCSETPTSPLDICMAYENHIVPPDCESGKIPSGNVSWGVARKYVAECSNLSRD